MLFRSPRCSFCGRSHEEVGKLVSGPRVYICDSCVAQAQQVIDDAGEGPPPARVTHRTTPAGALRRLLRQLFRHPGDRPHRQAVAVVLVEFR